ncbi:hypothetical protein BUALT_BualtUnG0029500 [Buddleja alternifolia]|uniref:BTB domain-containing protein n=1 Tax=Buddleja alternifolia TaxID=168488 RepID=A0AAV6W6F8_9LAMI|nr:hypothetical protein BUALT_BualtUnG0029500 [Buddleja alternifolia]
MKVKSIPPFAGSGDMPEPDVHVITSGGVRIPAHSKILLRGVAGAGEHHREAEEATTAAPIGKLQFSAFHTRRFRVCPVFLFLQCMRLLSDNFKAVEETEGWKFLQTHDPYLELEILQFIDETESGAQTLARTTWIRTSTRVHVSSSRRAMGFSF